MSRSISISTTTSNLRISSTWQNLLRSTSAIGMCSTDMRRHLRRTVLALARRQLARLTPNAKIVGGTNAYFAELNRQRPDIATTDAVCFSINPQVHAFDDLSLIESLQAQPDTIRSARQFCGDLPLHVGPITLKPRFNPNATGPEPPPNPEQLPPQVDARQCELLAAAWTLVSISQLAGRGPVA